MDLPESIESYFQEAGRVGRDGKRAYAILLVGSNDTNQLRSQLAKQLPDLAAIKNVYRKLWNYFQIPYGEGEGTMHVLNFASFCTTYQLPAPMTYAVFKLLERNSLLTFTEQFKKQTLLQILIPSDQIIPYITENSRFRNLIQTLLRLYVGIFDEMIPIILSTVAQRAEIPEKEALEQLHQLKELNVIAFRFNRSDAEITFLVPREDDQSINSIAKTISLQQQAKRTQHTSLIKYVSNFETCRSVQLLHYFGETNGIPCGICTNCTSRDTNQKTTSPEIQNAIKKLLESSAMTSKELVHLLSVKESIVLYQLTLLLEQNQIVIGSDNRYTFNTTQK